MEILTGSEPAAVVADLFEFVNAVAARVLAEQGMYVVLPGDASCADVTFH